MARDRDKPDIPPGTPLSRVLPMWITFGIVAVLGPWLFSAYWLNTMTTVACLTLAAGTVALLYGQLGMVSLAQFALAGVGGWFCLRLIHGLALPFEVALLLGALIAGVFGLILGLPALRMRGLYLALLTLMIAAAVQVVLNVIGFPDGGPGWTGKIVAGQRVLIERPWIARGDGAYFRYTMFWLAAGIGADRMATRHDAGARLGADSQERGCGHRRGRERGALQGLGVRAWRVSRRAGGWVDRRPERPARQHRLSRSRNRSCSTR